MMRERREGEKERRDMRKGKNKRGRKSEKNWSVKGMLSSW